MAAEEAVTSYYDPMAEEYHLLFEDWTETIERDGEALDNIINAHGISAPATMLDCACGIGTQAIGLARRGYTVHATDLSDAALDRARREAARFGAVMTFGLADIRALETQIAGEFDIVMAMDNALPHCMTDDELLLAVRNMAARLKDGGLALASMRDYDHAVKNRERFVDPHVYDDPEGRRLVFQVWDWEPGGRSYRVHQFVVRERHGTWTTREFSGEYRALQREELGMILAEAGFVDIHWRLPEESGYYQPLVSARKG